MRHTPRHSPCDDGAAAPGECRRGNRPTSLRRVRSGRRRDGTGWDRHSPPKTGRGRSFPLQGEGAGTKKGTSAKTRQEEPKKKLPRRRQVGKSPLILRGVRGGRRRGGTGRDGQSPSRTGRRRSFPLQGEGAGTKQEELKNERPGRKKKGEKNERKGENRARQKQKKGRENRGEGRERGSAAEKKKKKTDVRKGEKHGNDKTGPGNAGATIRCPGAFRTRFTRRGRRLRCRNERRFFRRHVPHGYPHRERSRADAPDGTVYSSLSVSA